jgi:hypothetical protein
MTWLTVTQLDVMADAIAGVLSTGTLIPYVAPARPFLLGTASTFGIRAGYHARETVDARAEPDDAIHRHLRDLTAQLAVALAPHAVVLADRQLECAADPSALLHEWRDAGVVVISATLREFGLAGDHRGPPDHPGRYREWTFPELQAVLDANGVEPLFGGTLPAPDDAGATIGVMIACPHTPAVRVSMPLTT